jgi:putative heme transporter
MPARDARQVVRRHGLRVASILVVGALFALVLPRIADYGSVWGVVEGLSAPALAGLVAAAGLNLLTFAPPWTAALPGLSFRHALQVSLASTAVANVAPGGDAVGLALTFNVLRRFGFDRAATTLALVVFSAWNQLVNVLFPVLAMVLLASQGQSNALLQAAAAIGVAVLAVVLAALALVLRSAAGAARIGRAVELSAGRLPRLARRPPREGIAEAVVGFRHGSIALIRRRFAQLTLATLAGHLTVWLVLLVALRAVGVGSGEVSVVESFAAWSLVRLLTAIPTTPGGLGVVELGLTGTLVGFGGGRDEVVAAVLLYRFLTFLPPIPLGLLLALTVRRHDADASAAR